MPKFGPRQTKPGTKRRPTGKPSGARAVNAPAGKPATDTQSGLETKANEPMRIAKAMAHAGLCSRRDAERWIVAGRVKVNGKRIDTPALDVGAADIILVDNAPMPSIQPVRLWRYHKPRGLVTTHRDPEGRATVFDNLPDDLPRVVSIGRLDYNTEGLLLLTTDGELARHLELPSTGWLRRYRVRVHGRITQAELDTLKDGCVIDGVSYGPIEATLDSQKGANGWLTLGLREGKNREVRRILGSLELTVNRLIRVSFGPFQLLDLRPGETEIVKRRVIVDQLGAQVASQFNFDAGLIAHPAGPQGAGKLDDDVTSTAGAKPPVRTPRVPRAARRFDDRGDVHPAGRTDSRLNRERRPERDQRSSDPDGSGSRPATQRFQGKRTRPDKAPDGDGKPASQWRSGTGQRSGKPKRSRRDEDTETRAEGSSKHRPERLGKPPSGKPARKGPSSQHTRRSRPAGKAPTKT